MVFCILHIFRQNQDREAWHLTRYPGFRQSGASTVEALNPKPQSPIPTLFRHKPHAAGVQVPNPTTSNPVIKCLGFRV